MASKPGRLTGGGIRTVPEHKRAELLRRLKIEQGRGYRVVSIRYRISGFRDPDSGAWIQRDPRNGSYYRVSGRARAGTDRRAKGQAGRHRTPVRPTAELVSRSPMMSLEVEIDRGGSKGPTIHYISMEPPR